MSKTRIAALISLLILLVLSFGTIQTATACIPDDGEPGTCVSWARPRVQTPARLVIAAAAKPTAAPTPAPVRRGGSPADAMDITEAQQFLDAGGNTWYKVGSGDGPQHLEVWLDAYGREGLAFAIYSPDQMNEPWPTTPPKGRGAPIQKGQTHDLYWSGQSPAGGTWYVLVTNYGSSPAQYTMGSNRSETERLPCRSYWEWVLGQYMYYTWCH